MNTSKQTSRGPLAPAEEQAPLGCNQRVRFPPTFHHTFGQGAYLIYLHTGKSAVISLVDTHLPH